MSEEQHDSDDYPLREASFLSCHARQLKDDQGAQSFVCEICGDVTNNPGCPMSREIIP